MIFPDSIVAIATPPGIGGICIVRLSGTQSVNIAKKITYKQSFNPRYAALTYLHDENSEIFDEAIIIYYAAPKSYTCEDVIEFQCHGGYVIGRKVLDLCLVHGARIAKPGEFTKRAFLNGRIDFSQVNAIAKMIHTRDSFFQKNLALQLKGELRNFVNEVRDILLSCLAYSEVMIDYSEEDISSDTIQNIHSKIDMLLEKLNRIYDFSLIRQNINNGWNLSIIGKPNVGKSSILNAILLCDRAITSPIAGTTRDTIQEDISIDGSIVRIIDTAGIRKAQDIIEQEGIKKSKIALQESNIVIIVFDMSVRFDEQDTQIIKLMENMSDKKVIVILNKIDREEQFDVNKLHNFFASLHPQIIRVNALQKEQTAFAIRQALGNILAQTQMNADIILSAPYQLESMRQTLLSLKSAKAKIDTIELELFSYHIKDALDSIGQITSPYTNDEMLDVMFSEFCLGK